MDADTVATIYAGTKTALDAVLNAKPKKAKTAEQILKGKAKVERARLKRVAAREAAKPKAKKAKKPSKLAKAAKVVKTKPKAKKAVKTMAANARTERLDMRLTKAEKAKVHTRASKLRRTVTSIVIEAIEKIR